MQTKQMGERKLIINFRVNKSCSRREIYLGTLAPVTTNPLMVIKSTKVLGEARVSSKWGRRGDRARSRAHQDEGLMQTGWPGRHRDTDPGR